MAGIQPLKTNWAVLGGLRFFLAWVVFSGHLVWFPPNDESAWRCFDWFGGKAAVVGFLMVSGYSIAASLEKNRQQFYRRRFLRLYPLYAFSLLLALGLQSIFPEVSWQGTTLHPSDAVTVAGNFLFLQMFLVKTIAYDPVLWSLSIEVSFYLLAPLLMHLRSRTILALIVISGLAFLIPRSDDQHFLIHAITRFNALKYFWAWLVGFLCFRDRRPVLLLSLGAIGFAFVQIAMATPQEPLASVTFLLSFLILNQSNRIPIPRLGADLLNYLGELSYPMYVIHFPCFIIGFGGAHLSNRWTIAGLTMLVVIASYHLIDVHFKQKFFKPLLDRTCSLLDSINMPIDVQYKYLITKDLFPLERFVRGLILNGRSAASKGEETESIGRRR